MKNRLLTLITMSTTLGLVAACGGKTKFAAHVFNGAQTSSSPSACGRDFDIDLAIKPLSSEGAETDASYAALLKTAGESETCKKEIIDALIAALRKSRHPSFWSDRGAYLLWQNGSAILAELKAVEALDLLIEHLDLSDGQFSASMADQPVFLAVKEMGTAAVPKLSNALLHNPNRNIRLNAALCLSDIGGADATKALKDSLASEPDQCVRRFIELSFKTPTNEVLQQRLLAFRCDN